MATKKILQQFVIRSHRSGMWLGARPTGTPGLLGDEGLVFVGRRAWNWTCANGGIDASGLAILGPKSGKITCETTVEIRRDDVIEIHEMSTAAAERLAGLK